MFRVGSLEEAFQSLAQRLLVLELVIALAVSLVVVHYFTRNILI